MKNTLQLNASEYKKFLDKNKYLTDIQMYKVPKENLTNMNSLKCILREEELHQLFIKIIYNENEIKKRKTKNNVKQ